MIDLTQSIRIEGLKNGDTFVWDDLSRDIELVIDCTENIR